jgi:hypothetical protein
MNGQWIWLGDGECHENERACFARAFDLPGTPEKATFSITADTRYVAWLNGEEIGRGPARSVRSHWFYDEYDVASRLRPGRNLLAVSVWNHGWSTYQTIASRGGLRFELKAGEAALIASDGSVRCHRDEGHRSFMPKRNVNLGFTDSYDASRFSQRWIVDPAASASWRGASPIADEWGTLSRPSAVAWDAEYRKPRRVCRVFEAENGCQQVTVNTRTAFFGDRRDANETIFTGFIATVIVSPRDMEGRIAFPNRTWNGIIGDFRIGRDRYPVSNQHRDIPVSLRAGRNLFLLQVSGKYDDLYCHLELVFPEKLRFEDGQGRGEEPFFVIGPTQVLSSIPDGWQEVYGGLDEYDRVEENTKEHDEIFACGTLEELLTYREMFKPVPARYTWYDQYLLSIARNLKAVREFPVDGRHSAILWDNDACVTLDKTGGFQCMILDFGDLYVGSLQFTLKAHSGDEVHIYCFENLFEGAEDYTIGLNNGMYYTCSEGWQSYRGFARIGVRYAMILVKNPNGPVQLQRFGLLNRTHASNALGAFRSGDPLLNQIYDMCRHTHELCIEDTFTDCPTYEQAFWIGDAQISSFINGWVCGDYEFLRHNIEVGATALQNTPMMNALTPTDWDTSIPMWAFNWITSIEEYVRMTRDRSLPITLYPVIRKVLTYYTGFLDERGGLLINAWNMLDWAALDIQNHCVVTGQQALFAYCLDYAASICEEAGFTEDSALFREKARFAREYIDRVLWREDVQAFADGWSPKGGLSKTVSTQTNTLLTLYDGILDPEKKRVTLGYVGDRSDRFLQAGSPFFLFYVYEVLAAQGRLKEVLEDVKARWGEMMRYDCKTCWEVFPGFYEVSRTRSYCHSWSTSPAYFLHRYALGVERVSDGFDEIRLSPADTGLTWCEGSIPTPHGRIDVRWSREGARPKFHLRVPVAIRVLPSEMDGWDLTIERI